MRPSFTICKHGHKKWLYTEPFNFCRVDWIRTSDPLHPIQVRYRAAPPPEQFTPLPHSSAPPQRGHHPWYPNWGANVIKKEVTTGTFSPVN